MSRSLLLLLSFLIIIVAVVSANLSINATDTAATTKIIDNSDTIEVSDEEDEEADDDDDENDEDDVYLPEADTFGVHALTADQYDDILGGSRPVVIEYYTETCQRCAAYSRIWNRFALAVKHHNTRFIVAKANVHDSKQIYRDALHTKLNQTEWPMVKLYKPYSTTAEFQLMGNEVENAGVQGLFIMINRRFGTSYDVPEHLRSCEFVGDECDPMIQDFYQSKDFDKDWHDQLEKE